MIAHLTIAFFNEKLRVTRALVIMSKTDFELILAGDLTTCLAGWIAQLPSHLTQPWRRLEGNDGLRPTSAGSFETIHYSH